MSVKGVNFVIKGSNQATPAMRQFQGQMAGVQRQMAAVQPLQRSWNKGLNENRRMVQQLGFQMGDFATQIAGGQSVMLAFVQQGGQMLQFFGVFGAVAAAALAVFGSLFIAITKSGIALNEIMPIFGVFQSELSGLVGFMQSAFNLLIDGINLILNNLDVLVTAAAFFFGKWLMGWVLSTKFVRVFTLSLALSRTMVQAKAAAMTILAAHTWAATTSMIVYRNAVIAGMLAMVGFVRSIFTVNTALMILRAVTLVSLISVLAQFTAAAIVSFGTVVARAVVMSATIATTAVSAFMSLFTATVTAGSGMAAFNAMSLITIARMALLNGAAMLLRGAFLIWNALTTAAALAQVGLSVAMGVANAAVVAFTWSLRAMTAAIVATGIGALVLSAAYLVTKLFELREATGSWAEVLKLLGDVAKGVWQGIWESAKAIPPALQSVWQSVVADFYSMISDMQFAWASMLGGMGRAVEGFMPDVANSFFEAAASVDELSTEWSNASVDMAKSSAENWSKAGKIVTDAWKPAGDAFQRIKDILSKDTIDIRDWFGGDDGTGGAGGAADKLKEDVDALAQEIKRIFEDVSGAIENSLMSGFKAVIKGTKSLKDYAIDVLDTILDKTIELLMQPIFSSLAGGIANSILGFVGLGPSSDMPSFAGGGYTGRGTRTGGVDGKGGYHAILHPNETVIDHTIGQTPGASPKTQAGGTIHLYVHESENFASTVDARAEGVAIKVSTEVVRQYDRKVLPNSFNRVSSDPTFKAR